MGGVYYNEFEPRKAAWLRHLIEEGAIARGVVDERPIQAVTFDDLNGYSQCHFFAGVGVWSYALRLAGWPDDRPVWTGSCPCGPFSVAGKKLGFADPRHLWPEWFRLIAERRPHVVFGEQSDEADAWVDLVSADMESHGYAVGSPDIPAAGFLGAHIRQRFFWVADADNAEWWSDRAPWHDGDWPKTGRVQGDRDAGDGRASQRLANADGGDASAERQQRGGQHRQQPTNDLAPVRMEHADALGWSGQRPHDGPNAPWQTSGSHFRAPGLLGGAGVDWLYCRDGRWRPVESGTSPLALAPAGRLGRLRGYGDAIDAQVAANFIGAYMDAAPARVAA